MKKNHVNEIFFLRSIACLTIVLLHSIAWGTEHIRVLSKLPDFLLIILDSLNVFLYYGTPVFIFITAFILGYSYKERIIDYKPFLLKRIKFILLPYICMAVLYALPFLLISFEQFTLKVFLNALIGDFHAYFVLIIFQFYLMFVFFKKWFDKHSPILVITSSLIINIIYLSVFNFTNSMNVWFSDYIWERYYWIPFPGWIFYYSLAYYTGRHYQIVTTYINQYKYFVFSAPVITSLLLLFLYHSEFITIHSSKRIDILFHTISIIALVLYIAMKMQRIPSIFLLISNYSYGIYLLHTLYMAALILVFSLTSINLGIFTILILFFGSILASIYTIYLFNLFPFGKYIVGNVDIKKTTMNTSRSTLTMRSISKFLN
ncbi:acyltransferase family protein [Alkalihalobacterium sp. APHAB7]|uniref:acyltransferase family protein n=1 Tax=Alkalihalobacterium sp. APHAB7 TaxID=3402081 RepID=UPI003AAB3373